MKLTHYHFPILPSTQAFARQYMRCLKPGFEADQWLLFSADTQTAGEGTRKRHWHSPLGNVCATFAFCLPKSQKTILSQIPLASVVALAEVVEGLGIKPSIKWINDLLINQKKIAGVLCESLSTSIVPNDYIILVGIGLNLTLSKAQCDKIDQPATSLYLETGHTIAVAPVLAHIGINLHDHLQRLLSEGFAYFVEKLQYYDCSQYPNSKEK